jgi:hypothetical protein
MFNFRKYVLIIAHSILLFTSPIILALDNEITACHGCSISQASIAARESVGFYKTRDVFVFDYHTRTLKKFTVYTDYIYEYQDRYPIKKAVKRTLNDNEMKALPELLALFDEGKNSILNSNLIIGRENFEYLHNSDNDVGSAYVSLSSSSNISLGEYRILQYPDNPSAHSFLKTSKLRNEIYNELFTYDYRVRQMSYLNKAMDVLDLGAISLDALQFSFKLIFSNGSSVEVSPSITTGSLEVISGTAVDSNGNTIPESLINAAGHYSINPHEMREWENFLKSWGVQLEYRQCSTVIFMTCSFNNNTLTCSIVTPACRY